LKRNEKRVVEKMTAIKFAQYSNGRHTLLSIGGLDSTKDVLRVGGGGGGGGQGRLSPYGSLCETKNVPGTFVCVLIKKKKRQEPFKTEPGADVWGEAGEKGIWSHAKEN